MFTDFFRMGTLIRGLLNEFPDFFVWALLLIKRSLNKFPDFFCMGLLIRGLNVSRRFSYGKRYEDHQISFHTFFLGTLIPGSLNVSRLF